MPRNYDKRKLTYEEAEYIRAQYKRHRDVFGKNISMRRLAEVFDVSIDTIHNIIMYKTYFYP